MVKQRGLMFNRICQYVMMLSGSILMGLAIALCSKSGWGADPITVMYEGVSKTLGISLGMASVLIALIMICATAGIDRKQLGIGTIINPIVLQVMIDYGVKNINLSANRLDNILFLVIGIIGLALGIAMTINANIGKGAYDALLISLSKLFKKDYAMIRWVTDALFIIMGVCLSGSVTWGTLFAILVLGKLVTFFCKQIKIVFNNKI